MSLSVTAPILSSPTSKRGAGAVLAGVSNLMETANVMMAARAPVDEQSIFWRASALHTSSVAQQVAEHKASIVGSLLERAVRGGVSIL